MPLITVMYIDGQDNERTTKFKADTSVSGDDYVSFYRVSETEETKEVWRWFRKKTITKTVEEKKQVLVIPKQRLVMMFTEATEFVK